MNNKEQINVDHSDDYSIKVHCDNCGLEEIMFIVKGKLVNETLCPKCGCKTIRKAFV